MEERPTDLVTEETTATYLAGPPAESADFDFLIGDWSTKTSRYDPASGKERLSHGGHWRARHLADRRIVLDETTVLRDDGVEVASMATLRSYAPSTGRWEMTFVSAHQPVLPISFVGRKVGDEVLLEVRPAGQNDAPVLAHVRFFDIEANRFSWDQRMSLDGGKSYQRTVAIHASRVSP